MLVGFFWRIIQPLGFFWRIIQPSGMVRIYKATRKGKGANRKAIPHGDMMAVFQSVSGRLAGLDEEKRTAAAAAAPLILEAENGRRQGLETKAAAALAASGLIATGLAVTIANDGWVRYLSLGGIFYLISAAWAALYALTPATRHVISAESAFEENLTAEILTVVEANSEPTLAVSNLATASLYDNARAGAILLLGLGILILFPSHPAPVVNCATSQDAVVYAKLPPEPVLNGTYLH